MHELGRPQMLDVLFSLFMTHLPGGAWVKDRAGHYVFANRYASERIFLRPVGEIIGRTDEELLPASVAAQFRENDERVVSTSRSLETIEVLPRDEDRRYSIVHKFPIHGERGEVAFVGGIAIDVTERRTAEEALREALEEIGHLKQRLQNENLYLREEIRFEHDFEGIVGQSPALRRVLEDVARVAPTDVTVLITGETGTGKELVARALHSRSSRAHRPLIKLSCGALSAGVVESELFGHEKGSFTGALVRRTGRFELAHAGTIFLDEVGELPPETQVKLLSVLQEGEFEPVGSNETRKVDCRVIAATNRDIAAAVAAGRFREDLYYRLNVFPIVVPPLRERASDIPLLAEHFLTRCVGRLGRSFQGYSMRSMERLSAYEWPGNVRELRNVVERAAVLSLGAVVEIDDVTLGNRTSPLPGSDTFESVERAHILAVLERTDWRVHGEGGAATILEIHPSTLRSRMRKLGIPKRSDLSRTPNCSVAPRPSPT